MAALALHDVGQDIHAPVRVPAHRELVFAPRPFRLRRWSLKGTREHHMTRNKHVQAKGGKEGGGKGGRRERREEVRTKWSHMRKGSASSAEIG